MKGLKLLLAAALVLGCVAGAEAQTGNCAPARIARFKKDATRLSGQVERLQEQIQDQTERRDLTNERYENDINQAELERQLVQTDLNNVSTAVQCIAQLDPIRIANCVTALGSKLQKRITALVQKERALRDRRDQQFTRANQRISKLQSRLNTSQSRLNTAQSGLAACRSVFFSRPRNNASVNQSFEIRMEGVGVEIAARGLVEENVGWFALIVDGAAIPQGTTVVEGANIFNYDDGRESTVLTLTPGAHTLTLQFVNSNGTSAGAAMARTINITVRP